MRRRNLFAALGLVLALPAVAAAATPNWDVRISPADQAKARSALIRKGDLWPEYRADPLSSPAKGSLHCRNYSPNHVGVTLTGQAISSFSTSDSRISSRVWVFQTMGQAERAWSQVVTPAYVGCLARTMAAKPPAGFSARVLEARSISVPRMADRNAGFRIAIRYSKGGASVVVYDQLARLGVGRANAFISLETQGHVCSCDVLKNLSGRVVGRLYDASVNH